MKDLEELASIITTIAAAIGAILGWILSVKWSKAAMDAKEDIIRQKEEKIQHLKEDRDERLLLKDEQISILKLQLGGQRTKIHIGKKKVRARRLRNHKRERTSQ